MTIDTLFASKNSFGPSFCLAYGLKESALAHVLRGNDDSGHRRRSGARISVNRHPIGIKTYESRPTVSCRNPNEIFKNAASDHLAFEITPLRYSFRSRKSLIVHARGGSVTPFSRKVFGIRSPFGRSIIDDTMTPG